MPKVSITLPSLRPDLLAQCVDSIRRNAGCEDYEIVVVSPFPAAGPKIKWIEEREKTGNCRAHATAYDHASGEIIVTMSDYIITRRNWLRNVVAFIEEQEQETFPFCAGLFWVNATEVGPTLGTIYGHYYPYYPAASRRSLEAVGGYFSREFAANFGDVDLGLRFWAAGGKCLPCWDAVINQSCRRQFIAPAQTGLKDKINDDMAAFAAKWRDSFGRNWLTGRIRAFNIDVPLAVVDFEDLSALPLIISQKTAAAGYPEGRVSVDVDQLPRHLRYGQS